MRALGVHEVSFRRAAEASFGAGLAVWWPAEQVTAGDAVMAAALTHTVCGRGVRAKAGNREKEEFALGGG